MLKYRYYYNLIINSFHINLNYPLSRPAIREALLSAPSPLGEGWEGGIS